jgi:hypothetical protein
MWQFFLVALGLVFVIEGLLPFLAPHLWRRFMAQMVIQNDKTLRIFGLISMLIGLGLLYFIH